VSISRHFVRSRTGKFTSCG